MSEHPDYPCAYCADGVVRFRWRTEFGSQLPGTYILGRCDGCGCIMGVEEEPEPAPRPAPRAAAPIEWHGDLGDIRRIPSAWYVPTLTGREVERGGYVRCLFHDDDRPSLHVSAEDARWHCFGCEREGGLPEFFCALQGRPVPTIPREFKRLVCDISDALRGAA